MANPPGAMFVWVCDPSRAGGQCYLFYSGRHSTPTGDNRTTCDSLRLISVLLLAGPVWSEIEMVPCCVGEGGKAQVKVIRSRQRRW